MKTYSYKILLGALFVLAVAQSHCSRGRQNERESRREQIRNNAESKRKELDLVTGLYLGELTQSKQVDQRVSLTLEIKEVPYSEDGEVDPVMVPELTGNLRFVYGKMDDEDEYIAFSVSKAEYDAKRKMLDLLVAHEKYGEINLSLQKTEEELTGEWHAPGFALSGESSFQLAENLAINDSSPNVRGSYRGVFNWDGIVAKQHAEVLLSTTMLPPQGMKISASVKLIFGEQNSTEFVTYRFDDVEFNPISHQLILKKDGVDFYLSGNLEAGEINGFWQTTSAGRMGNTTLAQDPEQAEADLAALRGRYLGEVTNVHPQSQLPKKVMINFITSPQTEVNGDIGVSGNIRFYYGPYDSLEYFELPFTHVQYNLFQRKLVAKTSGDYLLTIKLDVGNNTLSGQIFSDGLGELASLESEKS